MSLQPSNLPHTLSSAWCLQASRTHREEGEVKLLRKTQASGSIMTPAFSVLLCLGLCLCKRTRTQAADGFHKPSLRAQNGSLVLKGGAVTFRCKASWEAEEWWLEKKEGNGWSQIKYVRKAGNEGEFSLPSVTAHDAGTYQCRYRHSSYGWSERSDPLELVVTGLSAQPSLAALPSSEVASGQNVTLQCGSEQYYDWCVLYKDGQEITRSSSWLHGRRYPASFFFPAVNPTHEGTYLCYGFYSSSSYLWSSPSTPLVLRVSGTSSPIPESENRPSASSGLSCLQAGILVGVSAFLILTILFLSLLCLHRHWYRSTMGKGNRKREIKTTRSSEPAGSILEETVYSAVNNRQTEDARQEDTAALQKEDPQEVTYAQLNHKSLKCGAEPPPQSSPMEPSVYAAL